MNTHAALKRLTVWALAMHPGTTFTGDHPIATAQRALKHHDAIQKLQTESLSTASSGVGAAASKVGALGATTAGNIGPGNAKTTHADPLSDFQEGQWWVRELDGMVRDSTQHDQKRAVAVVHHMLRAVAAQNSVQLAQSRVGRVYLSGPMTGYASFNFPAFNAAAAALRAEGFWVVNPAEHGIVDNATWEDYLRLDIAKVAICESIALLPGWEHPRGANLEVYVAQALGMAVRCLDDALHPKFKELS